ncbi:MAG TPA: hypothetical protein VF765_37715 [Polyangiaceae bacterium]
MDLRRLFVGVLLAGAVACASQRPAPDTAQVPPTNAEQLQRALDRLKQPSTQAVQSTERARSVLDALQGEPEMQGDGGVTGE